MVEVTFVRRADNQQLLKLTLVRGQAPHVEGDASWMDFGFRPMSGRLGRPVALSEDAEEWGRSLASAYTNGPLAVSVRELAPPAKPALVSVPPPVRPIAVAPPQEAETKRTRPPVALVAALVALVVLAGYLGSVAASNKTRADDWVDRARTAESALNDRTQSLNDRTRALNRSARLLKRSEGDYKRLERRQRALASEKARAEDARGALRLVTEELAAIAAEQRDCTSGLTELFNMLADDQVAAVNARLPGVRAVCDDAAASFETFQRTFG